MPETKGSENTQNSSSKTQGPCQIYKHVASQKVSFEFSFDQYL